MGLAQSAELLELRPQGLYCPRGEFYIDPWEPVPRAVLTHAHGDHATAGCGAYAAALPGRRILERRLSVPGSSPSLDCWAYGDSHKIGEVVVSLHPAGHVLGSSQIRVEHRGQVAVVTGDFKRAPDPTCTPFEPIRCDLLITEATFALPIYRWPAPSDVAQEMFAWWQSNAEAGRASLLYCYALGKAQRILAELARLTDQTVYTHGAVENLVADYRAEGVAMLPTAPVQAEPKGTDWAGRLVLAPPSVRRSRWLRRFGDHRTGFASGWMQLRGTRRRRGLDRGFVLSDHADWSALLRTVEECGAETIACTHGQASTLARYLRERGMNATELKTRFEGEEGAA